MEFSDKHDSHEQFQLLLTNRKLYFFCSVFNTVMKCLGEDLKPAKEGPVTVEFLQDVSGFILSGHKLPE